MIDIVKSSDFDFGSAEYASLFDDASATAFQHPVWLTSFYNTLLPSSDASAQIFEFRDKDGALLGLVPLLLRKKSGLRLLETTDLGVGDYAAPVLSRTLQQALQQDDTIADRFRAVLPPHDIFRIRPVRTDHSDQWKALTGCQVKSLGFRAYATDLGRDFEDWCSRKLDQSLGRQLGRKERKLQREHEAELVRLTDATEISQAMSDLADLRKGRFEHDVIQGDDALRHYTRVAVEGAKTGFSATYCLMTKDGPVGSVFGISHRGSFYYLLIGCDYETWGKFSPGLLLYKMIIREWMGRGGDVFDFTIGGEDFKQKFGTTSTVMQAHFSPGSLLGRLACQIVPAKVMGEGGQA